jgi:hypothetical protein
MSKHKYRRLGKLRAEKIISNLEDIRHTATMKNAAFGFNDKELTNLIREKTSLWRYSWIIEPLDNLIAELKEIYSL